jgi:hypothetical protein
MSMAGSFRMPETAIAPQPALVVRRQDLRSSRRPLGGIRAEFADEVTLKSVTVEFEEDELERLVAALESACTSTTLFRLARAGSNTARNIELRCEYHNL